MTTYFITRHPGALEWAAAHHVHFDTHLSHLMDIADLSEGDVVIGTLPINIIYQLNAVGVRYIHLSLEIPPHLRGVELTVEQLNACSAQLEEFYVTKVRDMLD